MSDFTYVEEAFVPKTKKSYSRVAGVLSDEKECDGCQIRIDHLTNPENPQNTMCSVSNLICDRKLAKTIGA